MYIIGISIIVFIILFVITIKLSVPQHQDSSKRRRRNVTSYQGGIPKLSKTTSSLTVTERVSTWIHHFGKLTKVVPAICFVILSLLILLPGREMDYMNKQPFMPNFTFLEEGNIKVYIVERIGVDYRSIGTELLNDIHGTILPAIEKDQLGKTDAIIAEIFQRWLAGKGRQPVTWQTLVDVLRDTAKLHSLADDIVSVLEARNSQR